MPVRVDRLFHVRSGDYHAISELAEGRIPLVSCGDINHGLLGHFDIPTKLRYSDAITVAYNGQPLTAKFRPYEFGAKDDIGVLIPHLEVSPLALAYTAWCFNTMRWRFSYGRKCFRDKLCRMYVDIPIKTAGGDIAIDDDKIGRWLRSQPLDLRPKVRKKPTRAASSFKWERTRLKEIFRLQRGSFHSLSELGEGTHATVSRTENDNGVTGYFSPPAGSVVYDPGLLTVSTVTGDAFVQAEEFIATDNVIICIPLFDMAIETSYFVAAMINREKWRYGYGRQCYTERLSAMSILVPMKDGEIDQEAIKKVVQKQEYWSFVRGAIAQ